VTLGVAEHAGCLDDKTGEYNLTANRDGNEVDAWVALVQYSPSSGSRWVVTQDGIPETRFMPAGGPSEVEFHGHVDLGPPLAPDDPMSDKLELWLFLSDPVDAVLPTGEPPTDPPPEGPARAWWSYC
jgi:hypothetical protein